MVAIIVFVISAIWLVTAIFLGNDFLNNNPHPTNLWQPWVTAAGVITAALLSLWQQHEIEEREIKQRRRKSVAARAVMPPALANICEYAERCAHTLKDFYGTSDEESTILAGPLPVPHFPSDSIMVLRDCIEHADEKDIEGIAACIKKLQTQNSRVSRLLLRSDYTPITIHEIDSILFDTIDLHVCSSSLFPYARLDTSATDSELKEKYIIESASVCKIREDAFPSFFEYMRLRKLIS